VEFDKNIFDCNYLESTPKASGTDIIYRSFGVYKDPKTIRRNEIDKALFLLFAL
jgi:hypothetical protein